MTQGTHTANNSPAPTVMTATADKISALTTKAGFLAALRGHNTSKAEN